MAASYDATRLHIILFTSLKRSLTAETPRQPTAFQTNSIKDDGMRIKCQKRGDGHRGWGDNMMFSSFLK